MMVEDILLRSAQKGVSSELTHFVSVAVTQANSFSRICGHRKSKQDKNYFLPLLRGRMYPPIGISREKKKSPDWTDYPIIIKPATDGKPVERLSHSAT